MFRNRERKLFYYLFCIEAVTDLLVGAVAFPLSADRWYSGVGAGWRHGAVLCAVWIATDTVVCTASVWHLAAISLDRLAVSECELKTFREHPTENTPSFPTFVKWPEVVSKKLN